MNQDGQGADDRPEGRYANYFELGHNAFEFIWDCGQFHDGDKSPVFHTRIVTGPVYAKALWNMLDSAIRKYEQAYGPIREISKELGMDGEIEH